MGVEGGILKNRMFKKWLNGCGSRDFEEQNV